MIFATFLAASLILAKPLVVSDADRDCMIRTVWGEARGEKPVGEAAVAHVILNRAKQPSWWGQTVMGVCCHPFQFSCRNKDDPNCAALNKLCKSDDGYQSIAVIVDAVLNGHVPDPTAGATHYKVTGTKSSWDKATIGVVPVIIGHHAFYKLGPNA